MTGNHFPEKIPASNGKNALAAKNKPSVKEFFGDLPDWKIVTQGFKDELRQTYDPGCGDYTKERKNYLKDKTVKQIGKEILELQKTI